MVLKLGYLFSRAELDLWHQSALKHVDTSSMNSLGPCSFQCHLLHVTYFRLTSDLDKAKLALPVSRRSRRHSSIFVILCFSVVFFYILLCHLLFPSLLNKIKSLPLLAVWASATLSFLDLIFHFCLKADPFHHWPKDLTMLISLIASNDALWCHVTAVSDRSQANLVHYWCKDLSWRQAQQLVVVSIASPRGRHFRQKYLLKAL